MLRNFTLKHPPRRTRRNLSFGRASRVEGDMSRARVTVFGPRRDWTYDFSTSPLRDSFCYLIMGCERDHVLSVHNFEVLPCL